MGGAAASFGNDADHGAHRDVRRPALRRDVSTRLLLAPEHRRAPVGHVGRSGRARGRRSRRGPPPEPVRDPLLRARTSSGRLPLLRPVAGAGDAVSVAPGGAPGADREAAAGRAAVRFVVAIGGRPVSSGHAGAQRRARNGPPRVRRPVAAGLGAAGQSRPARGELCGGCGRCASPARTRHAAAMADVRRAVRAGAVVRGRLLSPAVQHHAGAGVPFAAIPRADELARLSRRARRCGGGPS